MTVIVHAVPSSSPSTFALEVDLYIPSSARLRLSGMFTVTVRSREDRPVMGQGLIVGLFMACGRAITLR